MEHPEDNGHECCIQDIREPRSCELAQELPGLRISKRITDIKDEKGAEDIPKQEAYKGPEKYLARTQTLRMHLILHHQHGDECDENEKEERAYSWPSCSC